MTCRRGDGVPADASPELLGQGLRPLVLAP